MSLYGRNIKEAQTIKKFTDNQQSHIFHFWNTLSDKEKDELAAQLHQIQWNKVEQYYQNYRNHKKEEIKIEPAKTLTINERGSLPNLKEIGIDAILRNKVAILTVAGGQASRLGYEKPKGCFPISPIRQKSLFQIFAEKIHFYNHHYQIQLQWYIMTSETNYKDTLKFFYKNNFFGLDKKNIIFFKQGMFPALTLDGKLILQEPNKIFMNPDGHGGILKALLHIGILDEMKSHGIEYLSYFQVDNPLVNLLDPYFIGYHIASASNVSTKVVKKLYPDEKLGTAATAKNKNMIIEYSDLPEALMNSVKPDGALLFEMGSIGIHIFSVNFLLKFTKKLPIHFANKDIEGYLFQDGKEPEPSHLKGIKFETFVFDVIPMSRKTVFFETQREEDFAPLKNKTGADSIETCINGQIRQHKNWLIQSGLVERISDKTIVEISPLFAPDQYIFLDLVQKQADIIREKIFEVSGKLKNEIYLN